MKLGTAGLLIIAVGAFIASAAELRAQAPEVPAAKTPSAKKVETKPKRAWKVTSMVVDAGDGNVIDMLRGQGSSAPCYYPLPEGRELETLFNDQVIEKQDYSKVPGAQMLPNTSVIRTCEIISKNLNLDKKTASGETICRTTLTHEGQVHHDPGGRNVFKMRQVSPNKILVENFYTMFTPNVSSITKSQYEKCE